MKAVCALLAAIIPAVAATIAHPHAANDSSLEYKVLPGGCPSLVEAPILNFVEEGETIVKGTGGIYGCETILECRVQASPPDVDILWYRNDELVDTAAVRDITMGPKGSTRNGERASLGLSELVHRLCVDTLPTPSSSTFRPSRTDSFQCKVQSSCDADAPEIVAPPLSLPRKVGQRRFSRSIRELVSRWHRAPVITLATSTRMELAGHFVQMMCRASGMPPPAIHWSILDEEGETNQEIAITQETKPSFLWVTEKGDLLVDTSKTQLASISFVCRAVNGYGSDEQSTTLILLKEED